MNEQRRQILQMLAEGKVTADEAERLINALERRQPETLPGAALRPKSRPKYLRLVVNSEDGGGDGPSRVNIQIPPSSPPTTGRPRSRATTSPRHRRPYGPRSASPASSPPSTA
ncbi:hypothetical protein OG322_07050 [Streptomyces sp. NBC_01260]|nr:hypothetical protein [Streptomyces sp. NBC_01260]